MLTTAHAANVDKPHTNQQLSKRGETVQYRSWADFLTAAENAPTSITGVSKRVTMQGFHRLNVRYKLRPRWERNGNRIALCMHNG